MYASLLVSNQAARHARACETRGDIGAHILSHNHHVRVSIPQPSPYFLCNTALKGWQSRRKASCSRWGSWVRLFPRDLFAQSVLKSRRCGDGCKSYPRYTTRPMHDEHRGRFSSARGRTLSSSRRYCCLLARRPDPSSIFPSSRITLRRNDATRSSGICRATYWTRTEQKLLRLQDSRYACTRISVAVPKPRRTAAQRNSNIGHIGMGTH